MVLLFNIPIEISQKKEHCHIFLLVIAVVPEKI